jgi:DNA-binding response OmpR family regulator
MIVEDHEQLARTLARGLRRHAMAVDLAHDGATALAKADVTAYDVIVLDRDLPVVHGDEVCRRLRSVGSPSRIIMVTAAATLDDLVEGLDLGADDYLTKPFELAELLARLRALQRRSTPAASPVLRFEDLELDPAQLRVTRAGRPVDLTPRELAVLAVLLRADGGVVSAEQLFEQAWDDRADPFTASVRVIVSRLRAKLGDPPLIRTVVTKGYRLAGATR